MIGDAVRLRVARALENGSFRNGVARRLSERWARHATVVRRLALPKNARVVGIAGPTLGGSYKTPLVLALARALAAQNERVAVVCHGYRGAGRTARVVEPSARVTDTGDDALFLARELERDGVLVVAGARRQEAVDLAARFSPLVLVDSLAQSAPVRLPLSILAVDAEAPWGPGKCPPGGDLRAAPERFLREADVLAVVYDSWSEGRGGDRETDAHRRGDSMPDRIATVESRLLGAGRANGDTLAIADLASRRVGVVLAVARPARVVTALAHRGIRPVALRLFADHATPRAQKIDRGVDLWLTTGKCATKLGDSFAGAPLFVLDHRLSVPGSLLDAVLGKTKHESPNSCSR